MRLAIGPREALRGYVRVALSRRQALVTEQLLDGAQIHVRVQEMGGVGVAQRVRGGALGDPELEQAPSQNHAHAPVREAAPAGVQEEGLPEQTGAPSGIEVADQRDAGLLGSRHHALLVALPEDPHLAAIAVEVAHVEADGLAHAQSGPVQQVEESAIAKLEPLPASRARRLDQPLAVLGRERRGKPALGLRAGQTLARIAIDRARAHAEAKEAAQGRESAVAGRRQVHAVESREIRAKRQRIGAVESAGAATLVGVGKALDLARVGAHGVWRQGALDLEVAAEGPQRSAVGPGHGATAPA